MADPSREALKKLPAVGTLLSSPDLGPLLESHGRIAVTEAVRSAIDLTRARILGGEPAEVTAADVARVLRERTALSLRRVINGTGVLLHTNLGRAVLADAAKAAVAEVAAGYSNVELDVGVGKRGDRHAHVGDLLKDLLETDGGLAFNNCAGAVLLMLAALCKDGEVIVARGQLVEIGGGFRVPDVMRESGAELVEVGTTNKVYARDYAAALTERTKAILVVHRSNFALVGFTAEPTLEELRDVAKSRGIPLLMDLGSGLLATEQDLGPAEVHMRRETRPKDALRRGADLVAFSGDKLLGGPQAGLLAGKASVLAQVKKHPLARALRADKLTLAGLEATLRLYRDGRAQEIPVIRDLVLPMETIEERANTIHTLLANAGVPEVETISDVSVPGGGSLPLAELPTRLVAVGRRGQSGRALEALLREESPPLIARMVDDRVAIDVRTVPEAEIPQLVSTVRNAYRRLCVELEEEKR